MLALYDQIQALRLELANNPCSSERETIAAELAAAEAAHAGEIRAFEAWFESA